MPSVQPVRAAARLAVETLESRRLMSQSGIFLDPAMEIPGPSAGALAVRQHGSGADAGPQASGGPEAPPLSSTIEGITFEQRATSTARQALEPSHPMPTAPQGRTMWFMW